MTSTVNLVLTRTEFIQVKQSIAAIVQDLENYKQWIDDRPMLPERELAVRNIITDIDNFRALQIKLYDAEREPS